ncbi:MAG: hypothetical protein ABIR04_01625 [Cypionkella sp.]
MSVVPIVLKRILALGLLFVFWAGMAVAAPRPSDGVLFVTVLSVSSSYANNVEYTVVGSSRVPDTVQWWISPDGIWRIRTFGVDHDIHVYKVEGVQKDPLEFAKANTLKHYGDVLASQNLLSIEGGADSEMIAGRLVDEGLAPYFDVTPVGFIFWRPDAARYFSQTAP